MSDDTEDTGVLHIPEPKFCPVCGSTELQEKFEGWEEHARKTGGAFGECAKLGCGAHFTISTYYEFSVDEDDEDDEEDDDE